MNKIIVSLLAVSIGLFLAPPSLFAQGDPPPPCCPPMSSVIQGEGNVESPWIQSEFFVSPTMLQLRGITRSQYIDRLSDSLFAGRPVALVVSSTNILSPAAADARSATEKTAPNDEALAAIQETRLYWLPRHRLTAEQLDRLDQVSITDGQVYIRIVFIERMVPETKLLVQPTQWP